MLNIIYGRESKAKEEYIFDHMSGKSVLIVPDQFTLEAERMAFDKLGVEGLMDIEVLDMTGLAQRILKETGGDNKVHINRYGRHMLLSLVMDRVKDRLITYGAYSDSLTFISMVNDFLADIRQNGVTPEKLEEIRDRAPSNSLLAKKLSDLCVIYSEYVAILGERYTDPETRLDNIIAGIPGSTYIREREIWISSFDSFTGKNMDMIEALAKNARSVNLVLCYDRGKKDSDLFKVSDRIIEELKERAGEISIRAISGYDRDLSPAIAAVEQELYAMPPAAHEDSTGIHVVKASNIYSGIESAAAYISHLVRDEHLRYREIALVCNSLDENQAVIKRIFDMYGIPLFIDKKRKVITSSVITFVLLSLDMVIDGFDTEKMLRLYKCGIWDLGDATGELDNYCHRFSVKGRMWERDFRRGSKELEPEELERLNTLRRQAVEPVLAFRKDYEAAITVHDRIIGLYEYLTSGCGIMEKIEKEIGVLEELGRLDEGEILRQIWNILCDLLDQIDEIIGEQKASGADLRDMLAAGLKDVETGIIPQNADAVNVGTCQRSRLGKVKAVAVICADEGVLPSSGGEDSLLSASELDIFEESDISLLNRDKLRRAEENMGIYRTFARPDKYLWIGCSGQDKEGNDVKPSPLIEDLKKIFPGLEEEQDVLAKGDPRAVIGSLNSTENHAVRAVSAMLYGHEIDPAWKDVIGYIAGKDPRRLENIREGLLYDPAGDKKDVDKFLDAVSKGKDVLSMSPSALERYANCPFSYFMTYALAPEEQRVFEMGPREIGDMYHIVFKRMADELTKPGVKVTDEASPWMTIDKESYESMMGRIVDEEISGYGNGIMNQNPSDGYRTGRLKEIASYIGWILVEHARLGRIDEAMTEVRFGRGGKIPPLEIEADGKKVYIEGIIDRLDILPGGSVKVIDYKTGREKFTRESVRGGIKLQLMVYLMAGMEYGHEERKPAGVFYFNIKDSLQDRKTGGDDIDNDALLNDFRLEGVMVNDESVIRSIAGIFESSSVTSKVSKLKSGDYRKSSTSPVPPEEFDGFIDEVKDTVAGICKDIAAGKTPPHPVKTSSGTACRYCLFKGICGFDTAFEGCRYRFI